GEDAADQPAPRHGRREEPLARERRRQEALAAEGHRPRPPGLDPRLPLGGRRQGDGAEEPQLLLPPAPQGAARRPPLGALAPGEGGQDDRRRELRPRRDQDEEGP